MSVALFSLGHQPIMSGGGVAQADTGARLGTMPGSRRAVDVFCLWLGCSRNALTNWCGDATSSSAAIASIKASKRRKFAIRFERRVGVWDFIDLSYVCDGISSSSLR